MELGLRGKTVIVTGGASNIGHGIAIAFANEGANVVIADIDVPQAERTAALATKAGGRGVAVQTDVTKPEQTEALAKRTLAEFGRIDVLVNNAGIGPGAHGYFRDFIREDAVRCMDLNFWGAYNCCKAVIEPMIAQRGGSIVNISSTAALHGGVHLSMYSAAKAAIIAFSLSLSQEFGPYGIRVNSIMPGRILPASPEQVGKASSKFRPRLSGALDDRRGAETAAAANRLGHPQDIGNVAVFLASDAAAFITGKALSVDGGATTDSEARLAMTRSVWQA